MRHQQNLAEVLKNSPSGIEAVRNECADLEARLAEVNAEIKKLHSNAIYPNARNGTSR